MNKKLTLYQEVFLSHHKRRQYHESYDSLLTQQGRISPTAFVVVSTSLYVPFVLLDLEAQGYIDLHQADYSNNSTEYLPTFMQTVRIPFNLTPKGSMFPGKEA